MKNFSVVVPTFKTKELILILVKSFEKYKKNYNINYYIIENSNDISYKNELFNLLKDRLYFENNLTSSSGSYANAEGIKKGLNYVKDEFVFICHSDVCVTSDLFFDLIFEKVNNGNLFVGTERDTASHKIGAMHISGIFCKTDLIKKINYFPSQLSDGKFLDVGDEITLFCEKNNIKHFCFDNTYTNQNLEYKIKNKKFMISADRCIDDFGNVLFMHLGRGTLKSLNLYNKKNKMGLNEWVDFCYKNVL